MGFFKKVAKKAGKIAVKSVNPIDHLKMTKKVLPKPIKKLGYKIDDKVGGAKGWSRYTGAAAVVVQAVPVIGTAAGIGLGAISAATGVTAAIQAEKKAKAEAEAMALAEMGGANIQNAVVEAAEAVSPTVPPGSRIETAINKVADSSKPSVTAGPRIMEASRGGIFGWLFELLGV